MLQLCDPFYLQIFLDKMKLMQNYDRAVLTWIYIPAFLGTQYAGVTMVNSAKLCPTFLAFGACSVCAFPLYIEPS